MNLCRLIFFLFLLFFSNHFSLHRILFQPERLTTSYYDIKSDVWSLGLSLIEISVGRYPIPALTANDYKAIFDVDPDKIVLGNGQAPPPGPASTEPKNMAIFELLNYIRVEVCFSFFFFFFFEGRCELTCFKLDEANLIIRFITASTVVAA